MSSSSSATPTANAAESLPKDNAAAPVEQEEEDEEVDSVATDDVPEPEWNSSDEEYEYCDYDLRDQADDDVQVAVDQKKPAGLKTTGLDDEEHPQKMVISSSVSSSSTSPSNATTKTTTSSSSTSSSDICPTCHGELHHPVQDCVKLQAWLQKRRLLPTIPPRALLACLRHMMHRYMIEQAPQYVDLDFAAAATEEGTHPNNHNQVWQTMVAEQEHNNPPESLLRPAPFAHLVYVCCTAENGWDLNRMVRDYEHVFLQHLLLQRHVDHRTNIIPRRAPRRRNQTPNPRRIMRRNIPRRNPLRDNAARGTRGGRNNPNPETTADSPAPAAAAAAEPANEHVLGNNHETNGHERIMQEAMQGIDDEQWEDDDDDQVQVANFNSNNEEEVEYDDDDHDNEDDYVVEDYYEDEDEEPLLNDNHRQWVAVEALLQELYPGAGVETHVPERYIPWCGRLVSEIMWSFLDWPVETLAENVAKLALWSAPRSITRVRRSNPAPHVHPFYDQIEYAKGDFNTLEEYLRDRLTRAVDHVFLIRRQDIPAGVTTTASIVALFDDNITQFEAQRQREEDEAQAEAEAGLVAAAAAAAAARKDDNNDDASDQKKQKQSDPKPSSAKRSRATTPRSAAAASAPVNSPTKNETTTARLKDPPPSRKRYGAPLAKDQAASTFTPAAVAAKKPPPPPQAPPPPDTDASASTQKPAPVSDQEKNNAKLELAPKQKQQPQACIICLDEDVKPDELFTLRCHHGVCKDCWKGYIRVGLDSGTGGQAIVKTCPAEGCTMPLTLNEVSILAPELMEKYEQRLLESFVQAHGQYVAWCPGPDCTQAAIVPPADLFEDDTLDIWCGKCSTHFCFRCKAAPHPGEPCPTPDPMEQEPEQAAAAAAPAAPADRPAAVAAVAVPNEEVAPENQVAAALVAHQPEAQTLLTKPIKKCPKCKVDIEKTGGCNRMRCRCGHAFCWLCLAENQFYDHFCGLAAQQRRQRQEGHRPNRQRIPPPVIDHNYLMEALRHEGPLDQETSELMDQLEALINYAHYYNRYHAHGVGQRFAESQCPCLEGRIMDYTHAMDGFVNSGAEVDFIRAANQTIYQSRRVLKYSYCSSFFLQQNSNQSTDDDEALRKASHLAIQLERLETFTEELSDISENALSRESRKRVLELIAVVEKTMSVMADMDL